MTDIRGIDLNLLRVLRAVGTAGSVSAAARRLGLSQPAVSGALARLRVAVGDPLFVRGQSGMRPTERARRLIEAIDGAFGLLQGALQEKLDFDAAAAQNTFTIVMSDIGEVARLPRLIEAARCQAPGVRFRISPFAGNAYGEMLDSGAADLICGHIAHPHQALRHRPLFRMVFVCMVRIGHPLVADELTPETYAALSHVVATRPGAQGPVVRLLQRLGLEERIVLTVPHTTAIPPIVAGTDLAVTTTLGVAEAYGRLGGLLWLALPHHVPPVEVALYWHERSHTDPGNRWLRELLIDLFASDDACA